MIFVDLPRDPLLVAGLALPGLGLGPAGWRGDGGGWWAAGALVRVRAGPVTGLGIAGALAVVGGATAPVGAGLTVAGAVVGGITYLAC